jgi:hypothetical protein
MLPSPHSQHSSILHSPEENSKRRRTNWQHQLPFYHSGLHSRSSSPTPSTPTHPPPLYSSLQSSTFPTSSTAGRKSLSPPPKDRNWNRRKAIICILVGVVLLLVIPLAIFGGVLHATRNEKQECANEGALDEVTGCQSWFIRWTKGMTVHCERRERDLAELAD